MRCQPRLYDQNVGNTRSHWFTSDHRWQDEMPPGFPWAAFLLHQAEVRCRSRDGRSQRKRVESHVSSRPEKGGEENDALCGMDFRRRHQRKFLRLRPEEDNQGLTRRCATTWLGSDALQSERSRRVRGAFVTPRDSLHPPARQRRRSPRTIHRSPDRPPHLQSPQSAPTFGKPSACGQQNFASEIHLAFSFAACSSCFTAAMVRAV